VERFGSGIGGWIGNSIEGDELVSLRISEKEILPAAGDAVAIQQSTNLETAYLHVRMISCCRDTILDQDMRPLTESKNSIVTMVASETMKSSAKEKQVSLSPPDMTMHSIHLIVLALLLPVAMLIWV
jgi:hypothetical protein